VALLACLVFPLTAGAQRRPSSFTVKIRLKTAGDSLNVRVAPLMYDKDFAFSFTLDDGLVSAYRVALPFFRGGRILGPYTDQWGSDQGAEAGHYPGLYYSDGCGHLKPFRASVALNAQNQVHDTASRPGFLSWAMADSLYHAGWDILSHGYSHATGPDVDVTSEVLSNNRAVADRLQVRMRGFVIPGGRDDYLSDTPYPRAAFRAGMETVQCEHFGNWTVDLDTAVFRPGLTLGRKFLHTSPETGTMIGDAAVFDRIAGELARGDKFWINAFTHGVGEQNLWRISLVFPQFRAFFERLAATWGEDGKDDMWMAPTCEVFEYVQSSRLVRYALRREGKNLFVTVDLSRVPPGLKYHELTLVVEGGSIKKVSGYNCRAAGSPPGRSPALVNVNW
jgi:hypothetical protein